MVRGTGAASLLARLQQFILLLRTRLGDLYCLVRRGSLSVSNVPESSALEAAGSTAGDSR